MKKLAVNGGAPIRSQKLSKRITIADEEKAAVAEVMNSGDLSMFFGSPGPNWLGGKKVKEFESIWSKLYSFKHAITVNSWTTGLMTAVGAIGIEPGDEVICPPYTMSASATSILFYGGIPVFADIDPDTFNIDPVSIEKNISVRTKAIMVVHLFGQPCAMDEIMSIAKKHNLKVIEDAAHAPGIRYKGRYVGGIGDIGGFSLNYHKHIHTGEGGILVTNNDDLALKSQLIRNHGENLTEFTQISDMSNCIGSNYRLTEIQAAIGVAQLKKLENCISHRNELADYFTKKLREFPGITPALKREGNEHAYYLYPIKFDASQFGISREAFVKAVAAEFPTPEIWEQTPLVAGYVKPLYLNPVYQKQIAIGKKGFPFTYNSGVKYNYSKGICPVVERINEFEMITCPLIRENISQADLDDLIRAIEKVHQNRNELA